MTHRRRTARALAAILAVTSRLLDDGGTLLAQLRTTEIFPGCRWQHVQDRKRPKGVAGAAGVRPAEKHAGSDCQ